MSVGKHDHAIKTKLRPLRHQKCRHSCISNEKKVFLNLIVPKQEHI